MMIDIKALELAIADAINHPSEMLGICMTVKEAKTVLALLKEQESIIESLKSDLHETLDVVSGQLNVVRCKDCKHWVSESDSFGRCGQWHLVGVYGSDWYCADGESRMEDEKKA